MILFKNLPPFLEGEEANLMIGNRSKFLKLLAVIKLFLFLHFSYFITVL